MLKKFAQFLTAGRGAIRSLVRDLEAGGRYTVEDTFIGEPVLIARCHDECPDMIFRMNSKVVTIERRGPNGWFADEAETRSFRRFLWDFYRDMGEVLKKRQRLDVVELDLNQLFHLLADSITNPAELLIGKCKAIGATEIPYTPIADELLLDFDRGHRFGFVLNDIEASIEVLERETCILQSGIMLMYPRTPFLSNSASARRELIALADSHYGAGTPNKVQGNRVLSYETNDALAYISQREIDRRDYLFARVGNRAFWKS